MNRVLRWFVRLFPAGFRERYGDDLADLLAEQARDVRRRHGWVGVVRMWIFQLYDLLRSALSERRTERRAQRARGAGHGQAALESTTLRGPGSGRRFAHHRRGESLASSTLADLRYASRTFRRAPVFTVVAVLTLALGIGGTTAIFSVVNGVLLKPLPYEDSEELVALRHTAQGLGPTSVPQNGGTYLTYRDENRTFEAVGIWAPRQMSITGPGEPEKVQAVWLDERTFSVLRVQPVLGRIFSEQELPEGPPLTLLGHGYWQRRYAGDPDILGETIEIDRLAFTIIGVMPAGFRFLEYEPALYLPLWVPTDAASNRSFDYQGIARLRAGVTLEDANDDIARMLPLSADQYGWATVAEIEEWRMGPDVRPLRQDVVGDVGTALWVLLGTFGMVLLLVCANVANLFLVRAESRRRELALRTALGASPGRIARQLLSESVLIGILGGIAGVWLGYAGLRLLIYLAPANLPRLAEIGIDTTVLLFATVVSVLTGVFLGVFPLIRRRDSGLVPSLEEGGRSLSEGRSRNRLRTGLAVAEVALALVLLVGSGLMMRSFRALRAVEPGFVQPEQVLTLRLQLPRADVPEQIEAIPITQQILAGIGQIPGVTSVGATSSITMERRSNNNVLHVEELPVPAGSDPPHCYYKGIAGDYFGTMGIPLLAGRAITWDDITTRRAVGVVTENIAREYWGNPGEALGKRIRHNPGDPWREIVGVVGNVRDEGLSDEPPSVVYWPMAVENFMGWPLWVRRDIAYVIRTARPSPASILPEVRQAIWSASPGVPLSNVQTLDEIVARSMARTSFVLVMLGIAAVVAVLLGVVGIYGVVSYVFAQRTREIGVRIALGATGRDVRWLVLRQGGLVAALGAALGLLAALWLSRFLTALLYGVGRVDPATFAGAALVAVLVALLATYLPARRAARLDPIQSLRRD